MSEEGKHIHVPRGIRQYQIGESDLAELERLLPDMLGNPDLHRSNEFRTKFRAIQRIIRDVRWSYGPFSNVEKINAEPFGEANDGDVPAWSPS